ncbi:N-6 DNA methylase [Nonomuraea sp. NPDC050310]|uniref:N-6 DNA methylase n=1 Tax=unclassified Nonomuraea TaxID=2593643 RepID=UPI0033FCA652
MDQDPAYDTVNAGDIARLAGVGRAAVSNWRRRHDDFPQPIGGTASQPLFSLRQIEGWLRRYGKSYQVSLADRVWQRLKAAGDLHLGDVLAEAGALLTGQDHALQPDVAALVSELAAEQGAARAYETLCERYLEAHSRQLSVTREELAALMLGVVGEGTLLDPACGVGTLLLAAAPQRALGQELSPTSARIAAARLRLRGIEAEIVAGDAMRQDGFPGERADGVICDPPFGERFWGYEELTGDPRWEYGVPPRGEPELAWVQHCLTHVRPGGLVAILMPPAAASRKAGRRIRANLLRAGALRAVAGLGAVDLWVLRRPRAGERPPSEVLLTEGDAATVAEALAKHEQNVRIIDLLTDDVDLTPARHRRQDDVGRRFAETRARFLATSVPPPDLEVLDRPDEHPSTTVGDLVKAGLVTVLLAPPRLALTGGELPVLTADDLLYGTPPSGRVDPGAELVAVEPGDVVASYSSVRVITAPGAFLGPHLTLYRVDPDRVDPDFLAGFLRAAGSRASTGSSRFDARRTRLPRVPLQEQRRYGEAFRALVAMEDAQRESASLGQTLVRLGFEGLTEGHLRP